MCVKCESQFRKRGAETGQRNLAAWRSLAAGKRAGVRPEQQVYKTSEEGGWPNKYRGLMEGVAEQAVALIYALKAFYPETIHHMDAATSLSSQHLYRPGFPLLRPLGTVPGQLSVLTGGRCLATQCRCPCV